MTALPPALIDMRNIVIETVGGKQPQRLVDSVSLSVSRGEVLGLIGESGAGKSTIGLAALGYTREGCRLLSGTVSFERQDIFALSERRRRELRGKRVAYVAQSAAAALNPRLTLISQCIEPLIRGGNTDTKQAIALACNMFRRMRLPDPDHIGERYPHELSGGQLQRVMTAMAMLPQPDLVVFDEPTTALDVTTQVEVLLAIRELIREVGSAAIYISHDLAVVMQLADRIMILRHGRMVEEGGTRQLTRSPGTAYAAALLNVQKFEREPRLLRSPDQPVLRVQDINVFYGHKQALENVSLAVCKGETLAVVGESGSGKSTLAKVLAGLLPYASGRISWNGSSLAAALRRRSWSEIKQIQLIHQIPDTALNPKHRVRSVVERPLQRFTNYTSAERARKVEEILSLVELDPREFIDRWTSTLSGGQKQRLCIARALAAEPELIICDEVTSALDPLVADGILRLLDRLQSERGLAYVFITHDLGIVRSIADHVIVMETGRVVEAGSAEEIFKPPYAAYTERLVRATPERRMGWLDDFLRSGKEALDPSRVDEAAAITANG
jgi:peptide/nickel transport system ATP-binding protein